MSRPRVNILEQLAVYAGDERMKSLFIWGAWTDRQEASCECCATPIAVLEVNKEGGFPDTQKRWVEIIDLDDYSHDRVTPVYWGVVPNLAFIPHTPERCKSLRKNTRKEL